MKKLITIIVVIILAFVILAGSKERGSQKLTIGAILPLSGPAAVWGEDLRAGMELALNDFGDETIEVIYEDSQGQAAEGLTAYNKLVDVDGVDVVVPALSRVSAPLIQPAAEDEVPLVVTLTSAMDVVNDENDWVYRLFVNAAQIAEVYFPVYQSLDVNKLGFLNIQDEYGVSAVEEVRGRALEEGLEIVNYSYQFTDADYRTQVAKLKTDNVDALNFVGLTPSSLSVALVQSRELDLNVPFFETAGILQNPGMAESLGDSSNGAYSYAHQSVLGNSGVEMTDAYVEQYGKKPSYPVTYGYDLIKLIVETSENGKLKGKDFVDNLSQIRSFNGAAGNYTLDGKGEITPHISPIQIVNGEVKEIKLQ